MINEVQSIPSPEPSSELAPYLAEPLLIVRDLPQEVRKRKFLPQLLDRLEKAGRLQRVRRGAYLVVPSGVSREQWSVDPYIVTAVLGSRSAVSFHSALALRGLAESVGSRVTMQTPSRFAKFTFDGIEFVPMVTHHVFGFEPIYRGGVRIQVTDVERTLLDGLRNPSLVGGLDDFLRSLEGVQRSDLLALIFDLILTTSTLPQWTRFRATYDDRRDELNQLAQHNLIRRINQELFCLGIYGLSFCPHPAADAEMENVRKVYAYLRAYYKHTPGGTLSCSVAATTLKMDSKAFARAALCLSESLTGVQAVPGATGQFPENVQVSEPILDCVDSDQLLAKLSRDFKLPPQMKQRKGSVVSVRFDKLLTYLEQFDETALYSKAGFMLRLFEQTWKPTSDIFEALRKKIGKQKLYFPQALPKGSGRFIREWNIIVPMHLHSRYISATEGTRNAAL